MPFFRTAAKTLFAQKAAKKALEVAAPSKARTVEKVIGLGGKRGGIRSMVGKIALGAGAIYFMLPSELFADAGEPKDQEPIFKVENIPDVDIKSLKEKHRGTGGFGTDPKEYDRKPFDRYLSQYTFTGTSRSGRDPSESIHVDWEIMRGPCEEAFRTTFECFDAKDKTGDGICVDRLRELRTCFLKHRDELDPKLREQRKRESGIIEGVERTKEAMSRIIPQEALSSRPKKTSRESSQTHPVPVEKKSD